ncbi:MAG: hypothetical protein HeimC3_02420 [Candidatus Heimdallarchaeota archaeon LC_3]|nr:MAG: hypothetical protein HeimC3_53620 [Candidatus Heimdallarchaeota archaeon LC_3]OLS27665.1 MAG: hypothetical protein HeimC3_02420 [Candidatus Heimdallarchaeota archaeon LC_3]
MLNRKITLFMVLLGVFLIFSSSLKSFESFQRNSNKTDISSLKSPLKITAGQISVHGDLGFFNPPWTGSGSTNDPYVINDCDIRNNAGSAIEIIDTVSHFVIMNCYLFENDIGIYLHNASNGILQNNTIFDNNVGIVVGLSENTTLTANNIQFSFNEGLIFNVSSLTHICNNTIVNNTIGINSAYSDYFEIKSNLIGVNGLGIKFVSSNRSIIFRNTIMNNTGYGVTISNSSYNNITQNNFLNNNRNGISQAYDDNDISDGVLWFYNYWDTLTSTTNPYIIDGPSNTEDAIPEANFLVFSDDECPLFTKPISTGLGITPLLIAIVFVSIIRIRKILNKKT